MGFYKIHKNDFRWVTNAHNCVFSSLTTVNHKLLRALNLGLTHVTNNLHDKLFTFAKTKANVYWIVNNSFDFVINVPKEVYSIYTFDI